MAVTRSVAAGRILCAVLFFALILTFGCGANPGESHQFLSASFQKEPIDLSPRTEIYFGELADDPEAARRLLESGAATVPWTPLSEAAEIGFRERGVFWLKCSLPDSLPVDASLHLSASIDGFEIFHGARLVYRPENDIKRKNKFGHYNTAIIPLNSGSRGGLLYIRAFSQKPLNRTFIRRLRLGSRAAIINDIMKKELPDFVIAFAYLLIGIFAILTFFTRLPEKNRFILTFGLFALGLSAFLPLYRDIKQLIYDNIVFWYYIGQTGYLTFPIALYAFFEQVVGGGSFRLIRKIWQLHAILALVLLILDFANVLTAGDIEFWYSWVLILEIAAVMSVMLNRGALARRESKIFLVGAGIIGVTGIVDVLISLGYLPGSPGFFTWGTVFFILCLALIIDSRFSGLSEQSRSYSHLLEQKSSMLKKTNEALKAQNVELERRVAARTEELDRKSDDLKSTLSHLQEMQKQLILQQKMAALGRLAASVARDIDAPLTTVSDVSNTVNSELERLTPSAVMRNSGGNGGVLALLETIDKRNRAASAASKSIAQTVKALKNFARLDEADFQPVDPRRGLEDTLRLLRNDLEPDIAIVKKLDPVPAVDGYPNQLNQVFMHILLVASRGIKENGEVTIETGRDGDKIFIKFGLQSARKEADFAAFFDKFAQNFGNYAGHEENLLDFSISVDIIRRHGGRLNFARFSENKVEFCIELPMKPKEGKNDHD